MQREDGFLDRLLWSYPNPLRDRWTTDGIGADSLQAVETLFDDLYRLEPECAEADESTPRTIRLSAGAR